MMTETAAVLRFAQMDIVFYSQMVMEAAIIAALLPFEIIISLFRRLFDECDPLPLELKLGIVSGLFGWQVYTWDWSIMSSHYPEAISRIGFNGPASTWGLWFILWGIIEIVSLFTQRKLWRKACAFILFLTWAFWGFSLFPEHPRPLVSTLCLAFGASAAVSFVMLMRGGNRHAGNK